MTQHHRFPKSRCAEFGLNWDDPRNLKMLFDGIHEAYEMLFNSKIPEEAIKILILEYLPPPTFFDPARISNKHLRAYIRQVWKKKMSQRIVPERFKYFVCGKCGGKIVAVRRQKKILAYNCEMCGEFESFSCMLCGKPARISINPEEDLFICGRCILNIVQNHHRLPKRYRQYYKKMRDVLEQIEASLS
jgi:transcription elongation factor Elf1